MSELVRIITAVDPATRNLPLSSVCDHATVAQLMEECQALDRFRRDSGNLYERVRALFFLSAIFRYHLPPKLAADATGRISYDGYVHLLQRRFEEAIRDFGKSLLTGGPSEVVTSALAAAYRGLGFETLSDQVRKSVRSVRGNQWMFRVGHVLDYPLTLRRATQPSGGSVSNPR